MEKAEAAKKIIDSLDSDYWSGIFLKINDESFRDYEGLGKDMLELSRKLESYFNTIKGGMNTSPSSPLLHALNYCGDICRSDGNGNILESIEEPLKIIKSQADLLGRELKYLYVL